MTRIGKISAIILAVVISLTVAELVREKIAYVIISRDIEAAYERTAIGMAKEDVKSLAGEPDWITTRPDEETLHWAAMNYQGALWKLLGLTWVKGHYTFAATFDVM